MDLDSLALRFAKFETRLGDALARIEGAAATPAVPVVDTTAVDGLVAKVDAIAAELAALRDSVGPILADYEKMKADTADAPPQADAPQSAQSPPPAPEAQGTAETQPAAAPASPGPAPAGPGPF